MPAYTNKEKQRNNLLFLCFCSSFIFLFFPLFSYEPKFSNNDEYFHLDYKKFIQKDNIEHYHSVNCIEKLYRPSKSCVYSPLTTDD